MRAFVLGLLIATGASAQQVQSILHCDNWPALKSVLVQNGEEPALQGLSHRNMNGQNVYFQTIVFANPQNGNYSVIEHWGEEMFCVIQSGTSLHPYQKP